MRLVQILLAVVVTLYATTGSTDAFSVAAQDKHSALTSLRAHNSDNALKTERTGASSVRSLRVGDTKTAKEDDNEISEKRGLNIGKNFQVQWWAETKKTDEFVLKALKLKGLSGTALTTNKNYKYFLKFLRQNEKIRVNQWIRDDTPPFEVWVELGMKNVRTMEQLESIKGSNSFRIYKRYVNELDDSVFRSLRNAYDPPLVMLSRGATKAEVTARVQIMAESKRPEAYAKIALGLTVRGHPQTPLNGAALTNHDDYKYFELFLAEAAKVI